MVVKEVKEQQKPSIIEQVISNREVKYVYPEDVNMADWKANL